MTFREQVARELASTEGTNNPFNRSDSEERKAYWLELADVAIDLGIYQPTYFKPPR